MNIQTDRALVPAGSTAERFLAITITAPVRETKTDRPTVNVALVLDRSGSMAGRKIEMARKAVEHAVRLVNERDRLALICYDTEIDTLLGATAATPEAKELALSRLRQIDARGSTDLAEGGSGAPMNWRVPRVPQVPRVPPGRDRRVHQVQLRGSYFCPTVSRTRVRPIATYSSSGRASFAQKELQPLPSVSVRISMRR